MKPKQISYSWSNWESLLS